MINSSSLNLGQLLLRRCFPSINLLSLHWQMVQYNLMSFSSTKLFSSLLHHLSLFFGFLPRLTIDLRLKNTWHKIGRVKSKMRKFLGIFLSSSILKFILGGCCSTAIDFAVYILLSVKLSIIKSKGISLIIASIFSYVVNKRFTFQNKEKTNIGYLIRFYIVFFANFAINIGVNYFVYEYTGHKLVGFLIATICGMLVNYLGQKFFVFA